MAAAQLQHDHRNWLVLWGCYTHVYIAFPLFRAPRGTVLTATVPADLAVKMRRQERFAGVHSPPPEARETPGAPAAPGGGAPGVGAPLWPPTAAPAAPGNRDQPAVQGWYAAPDAGDPPPPPPPPGPPSWPGR